MPLTAIDMVLIAAVAVLSAVLIGRIVTERRRTAALRRMNLADFSDFLKSNRAEGSIQDIAGQVSRLLREACGCRRIIFLRKRRRILDLNYFHGINRFDRRVLRLKYTDKLVSRLTGQVYPE